MCNFQICNKEFELISILHIFRLKVPAKLPSKFFEIGLHSVKVPECNPFFLTNCLTNQNVKSNLNLECRKLITTFLH